MSSDQERQDLNRQVRDRLLQAIDDLNETMQALQGCDLKVVADVEGRTGHELLQARQDDVARWVEAMASLKG
jgi:hypothetical protein